MAGTYKFLNFSLNTVNEHCRNEVSNLFCSLTNLVDNYKRLCPTGTENLTECITCQRETSLIYEKNSWILTCN